MTRPIDYSCILVGIRVTTDGPGLIKNLLVAATFTAFLPHPGLAQYPAVSPIDIIVFRAPQPVMADGRIHLLYELQLTSFSPSPIELLGLDVLAGDETAPLASYRDDALEALLGVVGPTESSGKVRVMSGGRSVVIFVDLTLKSGGQAPKELRHRLSVSTSRKTGGPVESTVSGPVVAVVQQPAPVLGAPLHGSGWVAFNALSSADHRRAVAIVDCKARISQRFAIDWMRLGPDGRLFHGDSKSNANFYGYGADVLAVADGQVSELKDGLPDNASSNQQHGATLTLDTVTGNHLILDLGQGRFALYAHLQPRSLQVKLGDKVKAGQTVARLGNSGQSDQPHLHFQVMDANSSMGAEGLPYELDSFIQVGLAQPQPANPLDWQPRIHDQPVVHQREFPVDKARVTLP
jgi:murein DD-endopeptidase